MRYTYIKDKPGKVTTREEWVFKLFDDIAASKESALERNAYQNAYNELKFKMIGTYVNESHHKYYPYLQELVRKGYVKRDLLDYVLINNFDRDYFEKIMSLDTNAQGITLGVAFPWLYPGTDKKTGAQAVHQIFIWDLEAWIEKTNKWYYKLFFWKKDYKPLHPDLAIKGLLLHELVHAKQYIIDQKREPPKRNGSKDYRNYLEKEAYSIEFEWEDRELGYPENLERWGGRTYEEAADNYLKYLTSNED